jgi:hypothetical protein
MANNHTIEECVRNGKPIDHIPVIDFHCHLGASSDYYYIPRHTPGELVKYMDRYGVDHIVTFSIRYPPSERTLPHLRAGTHGS